MMGMYFGGGFWFQYCFQGVEVVVNVVYVYCFVGIYYIDIGCVIRFYFQCLLCQCLWGDYMVYYQKIDGVYFQFVGKGNMLCCDVCFVVVGGDLYYLCFGLICCFQIVQCVDVWQQ